MLQRRMPSTLTIVRRVLFAGVVWTGTMHLQALIQQSVPAVSPATPLAEILTAAKTAERGNNPAAALSLYQEALRRDTKNSVALQGMGVAYLSLNKVQEAVDTFKKLIEVDPYHFAAYGNLGVAEYRLGRVKEAEAAFKKHIEVNPLDPIVHKNLGRLYLNDYLGGASRSTLTNAIEILQVAVRLAPKDATAKLLLGRAYVEAGERVKGQELIAEAQKEMPDSAKTADLNNQGTKALEQQRFRQAADFFKQVIEIDPRHPWAWNNLGRAYSAMDQDEEALGFYRKQIEVSPKDQYSYNNLGQALLRLKRKAEAEQAFRKQMEVSPEDVFSRLNLGRLLVQDKRAGEAIIVLEAATRLDPSIAAARYYLGAAYLLNGEKEKGTALIAAARKEEPGLAALDGEVDQVFLMFDDGKDPDAILLEVSSERTRLEENLFLVGRDEIEKDEEAASNRLAALWAIMGNAWQRKGELPLAERHLLAAWMWTQSSVVGDRLGRFYEKTGEKLKAITFYRRALGNPKPPPESRSRFEKLVGGKAAADSLLRTHSGELSMLRTVDIGPFSKKGSGEYLLRFHLQGNQAAVKGARFLGGDKVVAGLEKRLATAAFKLTAPSTKEVLLVRKAIVYCSGVSCAATLMPVPMTEMMQGH